MDVEKPVFAAIAGQFAQKIPVRAFSAGLPRAFQLVASPKDGSFGPGVEPLGIEQCPLIVVAQQAHVAVHDQIDALARIRTVADDVPQAINLCDALLPISARTASSASRLLWMSLISARFTPCRF